MTQKQADALRKKYSSTQHRALDFMFTKDEEVVGILYLQVPLNLYYYLSLN